MRTPTSAPRVAQFSCSLEVIVAVLGGKWKPGILFNLLEGPLRFAQIRRRLGVSEKVLAHQLRELESHGVVSRVTSADRPPRVTYSLTRYGKTLGPILIRMGAWGEQHLRRLRSADGLGSAPTRSVSLRTVVHAATASTGDE